MEKYFVVLLLAFQSLGQLLGQSAFAETWSSSQNSDSVQMNALEGKTVITLAGADDSAAAEIYVILDKSGAEAALTPAGRTLSADLISASVSYLRGQHFEAQILVPQSDSAYGILPNRCAPASVCQGQNSRVEIRGKVARELDQAMQKAAYPADKDAPAPVDCHETVLEDGSTYNCALELPKP